MYDLRHLTHVIRARSKQATAPEPGGKGAV
jgi:hypothetical protein